MKTLKLKAVKLNAVGALTRTQQKDILGGNSQAILSCLPLRAACNDNVQCCSNYCEIGDSSTGYTCQREL